jgi:hypothetical protein
LLLNQVTGVELLGDDDEQGEEEEDTTKEETYEWSSSAVEGTTRFMAHGCHAVIHG